MQPARYAVFLCEASTGTGNLALQGGEHSNDKNRVFFKPVYKLFNGMPIGDSTLSIAFNEYHQSDKLGRMVNLGKLQINDEFDIQNPPFVYRSDRDDIVSASTYAGNFIVWRKAQVLCRVASQNEKIVTFDVPKESLLWLKSLFAKLNIPFFYNNRRYTSLRVGQNPLWAVLDYGLNALLAKLGSDKRVFLSPRHAGEFTNIRHVLNENNEIVDLNLAPISKFKSKLSAGAYQAVMYEDPVAEGYIHASITGADKYFRKVRPAYSLMTAPDFMPRIGNIDIGKYNSRFVTGGTRALCEGRLPVNLRLNYVGTTKAVFDDDEETITAITASARTQENSNQGALEYDTTHYLSDEASDIFAPGWDVTYTRDSTFSTPYYHTSGLGSPFLEDVKLCAAANGMWPAASPDAARTFKRTTRTAFPLTDQEIGLAPSSALAIYLESSSQGWDGEYGPFVQCVRSTQGEYEFVVNYASIERSDYISNYDKQHIDFAKLKKINRKEGKRRLEGLSQINDILLGDTSIEKSGFWLVSFIAVTAGSNANTFVNLP